jgi:hypothetical protein
MLRSAQLVPLPPDCLSLPPITPLSSNIDIDVVRMAHAVGPYSRTDPKGFQLYKKQGHLTALCKNFWGQPKKLSDIEKGADIKFNYNQVEETGQRLYFFEQYGYLRDRIDAFRARDPRKEWKRCIIVTGTPGIGKAFYLPSRSD